ncbi:diguanylate cyclase [Mariprofundus sp. KV]|uniref:sensor domain-containing diguanylate cyclase n=1 Tax=Mariprofundus sp. KV TaxID=2608715 RepID=UPI0015A4B0F9|nr:diguanylate cyclase [Mariprofundus sp. KV]
MPAQAAPLHVNSTTQIYELNSVVEHLEDKSGQLTINEIRDTESSLQWLISRKSNPNFGFSQSAYWFRITLINQNHAAARLSLVINNPLLDQVTLYKYSSDKLLEAVETGDRKAFSQRPHEHLSFVFPVTVAANEPLTLYIRVSSEGSVQVPLSLYDYDYYHHYIEEQKLIIQGLYFGVLIFMMVFNLFVYFRTKAASHLFFVLYVLSAGLLLAGLNGLGYKYLWQPFTHFQQHHIAIFTALSGIFLSAFIYRFLGLQKKKGSITGRLLLIVIGAFILLLLLSTLIAYHDSVRAALLLLLVPLIIGLYSGLKKWNRDGSANTYFTLAWAQFLIFLLAVLLAKFGIIPRTFLSDDILAWTTLLQVVLFSMALGERMNGERKKRIQAQKQIIRMQGLHKKELELQVKERTAELKLANEQLEVLATTDALTGLYNRRHFLNQAQQLINISIRHQHPIAMVMLDIDHFKEVNDSHGHAAGDHVLRELSKALAMTSRQTDIIGRVGGEEFAILLIDATPSMAGMLAERLRGAVEALTIAFEGTPIPLTISAGICTKTISQKNVPVLDMMRCADSGLYQAKEEGRNRVISKPLPETQQG